MQEWKMTSKFEEEKRKNTICIFLFGSSQCMPCQAIKNKIDQWKKETEIRKNKVNTFYISVNSYLDVAAQENVFTVPSLLVYVQGKRTIEVSGYFSLDQVFDQIERYLQLL